MKEGNQFLTTDSKIVLLLILRSTSFHKRNPSFYESCYRTGVFPDRIASLKSTRTNVLQGYTFVNKESQLIKSTLICGEENYRKEE